MLLAHATWPEVEAYLEKSDGIIIPLGSIEQHGPIGLIGTDMLCAESIATEAGNSTGALVAPTISYSPAEFNMAFPETISLDTKTFRKVLDEIIGSLARHGFRHFYFLNGHGANIAPLAVLINKYPELSMRMKNWWGFRSVNALRRDLYDVWEGMHATPSEVAMTRAFFRTVEEQTLGPPEQLDAEYLCAHAGDQHGLSDAH